MCLNTDYAQPLIKAWKTKNIKSLIKAIHVRTLPKEQYMIGNTELFSVLLDSRLIWTVTHKNNHCIGLAGKYIRKHIH